MNVLNYEIYDRLQAQLGGVSANFHSNVEEYLSSQQIDPQTRQLLSGLCAEFERTLDEISGIISDTLIAAGQ